MHHGCRCHELDSGWWFQLDRAHDTIAVQWVAARNAWIGGSGPLGGPVTMSHMPLTGLEEPTDRDDAERIARVHLQAVLG